jgi:hypothetical protein
VRPRRRWHWAGNWGADAALHWRERAAHRRRFCVCGLPLLGCATSILFFFIFKKEREHNSIQLQKTYIPAKSLLFQAFGLVVGQPPAAPMRRLCYVQGLFSSQIFFPKTSHQIFEHIHKALNIDKKIN